MRAAAARDEEAARRVLDGAGGRLELDGRLHIQDLREELVGVVVQKILAGLVYENGCGANAILFEPRRCVAEKSR